jgi:hypothetical protein
MSAARKRDLSLAAPVSDDAWTFLQALAWIKCKDEAKALDHREQVKVDRALTADAPKTVADYRRLKEALREGSIHCWGYRERPRPHLYFVEEGEVDELETTGGRELIPAVEWLDRRIEQNLRGVWDARLMRRRRGVRVHLRPPLLYRDLRLDRTEVMAAWPRRPSTGAEQRPAMTRADYEKMATYISTVDLSREAQHVEMRKRYPNMRVKDFVRACRESGRSAGRRRKS